MGNRTDFKVQAGELGRQFYWHREVSSRVATELNNAFVAGQERADTEAKREKEPEPLEHFVCMDCTFHKSLPTEPTIEGTNIGYVCPHWTPEFWVEQGFKRNWGDAAISHWPEMEVLRKEERRPPADYDEAKDGHKLDQDYVQIYFVILAPRCLRRPLKIDARGFGCSAWGAY